MPTSRVFPSVASDRRNRAGGSLLAKLLAALLAGCLSLVFTGQSGTARAALQEKNSVQLLDTWNPRPDTDPGRDIILPMPKGLSMVFRVVAVPGQGVLTSLPLQLGIVRTDGPDRRFYDSSRTVLLSAPYRDGDIPRRWNRNLPAGVDPGRCCYYLIAKYEVSRLQWKAVMEPEQVTSILDPADAKPKTDISWHDAVRFTERYTEWLLKHHPDALPSFAGDTRNTGFVRLPTEAEWEYAARGGQREENLLQDFFSMKKGHRLNDYAVYREAETSVGAEGLQRIGSRLPNPLGLHDTAGNAAEMTSDFFRFSVGELQGSAGGFVIKGGSCLSSAQEIMPGRREEFSPFLKGGHNHAPDLGFRPVVSGINTPGGERSAVLKRELAGLNGRQAKTGTPGPSSAPAESARIEEDQSPASLLAALDRLIAEEKNERLRQVLMGLRGQMEQTGSVQPQPGNEGDGTGRSVQSRLEAIARFHFGIRDSK